MLEFVNCDPRCAWVFFFFLLEKLRVFRERQESALSLNYGQVLPVATVKQLSTVALETTMRKKEEQQKVVWVMPTKCASKKDQLLFAQI